MLHLKFLVTTELHNNKYMFTALSIFLGLQSENIDWFKSKNIV